MEPVVVRTSPDPAGNANDDDTRQGAEVTVKDVSVMSVEESEHGPDKNQTFTYACKWIVTARVKHWQHLHDHQNVYVGELTIRIEEERWKIARLNLLSEERVVLSRQMF